MSSTETTVGNRRYWNAWTILWLLQIVLLIPVLIDIPIRLCLGSRVEGMQFLGSLPVLAYAVLVGSLGGTLRGRRWLCGHRNQLLLSAASMLVAYLFCELAATLFALHGVLGPRTKSLIVYENAGKTIRFDPVRGYRLGPTSSRFARITNRTVEFIGHLRGNNEGFPDRDDMFPRRLRGGKRRLAVFGDSFTAAQFLKINWPDLVEDLTRGSEEPWELLNFSVDGGGLANWWNVLNRIVEMEKYQIDGVVFAVFSGDLRRGFSITEYQGYRQPMFARIPSWNPRYFPFTGEQAKAYFEPWDASIVGTEEFNAALKGEWRPRPPVPYLAGLLAREVLRPAFRRTKMSLRGVVNIESERRAMIQDIRRVLKSMSIPALVVYIPDRGSLIDQGAPGEIDTDTREFAAWIEAECVNGGLAFNGRTASQIRADWLPFDGHWGQEGSDRFAKFMVEILAQWSERQEQRPGIGIDDTR